MTQSPEDVPVRPPLIPRQRVATSLLAVVSVTAIVGGTAPAASAATLQPSASLRSAVNTVTTTARKLAGCKPLVLDTRLTRSAQQHATEMSKKNYFSHSSANGTSWLKRIKATGYKYPGGENIARGYPNVAAVEAAWLASPGHRANILDCQFRKIGVGYAGPGSWGGPGGYWVEDFGY